jgi:hypothetical protein
MKATELERTTSRSYTCYEAVCNRLSTTVCFDNQEMNNGRKVFKHIMNKLAECVQFIGIVLNVLNWKFLYENQKKINF